MQACSKIEQLPRQHWLGCTSRLDCPSPLLLLPTLSWPSLYESVLAHGSLSLPSCTQLTREDSYLDFRQPAAKVHNMVRALAGWPGARATLLVEEHRGGE